MVSAKQRREEHVKKLVVEITDGIFMMNISGSKYASSFVKNLLVCLFQWDIQFHNTNLPGNLIGMR